MRQNNIIPHNITSHNDILLYKMHFDLLNYNFKLIMNSWKKLIYILFHNNNPDIVSIDKLLVI